MFKKYWGQERSNLWSFLLLHCHLLIDDHILYSDHSCSLYIFIERKKIWTKIHFFECFSKILQNNLNQSWYLWMMITLQEWQWYNEKCICLVRKHDKFTNYCDFFTGFIVFDINNKCTEAHNSLTSNYVQTLLTYLFSYWLPGGQISTLWHF